MKIQDQKTNINGHTPVYIKKETENSARGRRTVLPVLVLAAMLLALVLTGCSVKDISSTMGVYFAKQASSEEETAGISMENRMFTAQVHNSSGEPLTGPDGESVTVLAAYETATGGEDRVNEKGILETYPLGQVMTYKAGEAVIDEQGEPMTYQGGEAVTDVFGNPAKDDEGNYETRFEGETVTHGDSDILYDADGEMVRSEGEPLTYAAGEYMYNTDGEQIFTGLIYLKDEFGRQAVDEEGNPRISRIEIVTDANGDPLIEEDGEIATRVLEPLLPGRVIDQAVDEGIKYICNKASKYVYFSAPYVPAANVSVPAGAEPDTAPAAAAVEPQGDEPSADVADQNAGQRMIHNLQLEILGKDLPYFDLRFDAEGYGYFVMQDTEMVLGVEGSLRNGANVLLQEMEKIPYPQYAYWDEPVYTLEDHQKWIIKKTQDGYYEICSAANQEYCMTVDDQNGIHYANIMLWRKGEEERDQQKFMIQSDVPVVETVLEPRSYFIRTGLSDWMMVSIGDNNRDDGRNIYLYHSDGLDGQVFTVSYDEYGLATIAHADSTKVLSVENGEAVNSQNVFQYEYDGGDWQKWILEPIPNDTGFIIRSARNVSEVLNLMHGFVGEVQPIKLYWNDNTVAQNWYFETEAPEGMGTYETMEKYAQKFYSDTGYLILINNITNKVGIYTGYQYNWTCIHYWDCVTGKPSTPTLRGHYTIIGRIPSFDGDTDSPELYTCYYATMFYPEYYFHSQVYYQATEDLMDGSIGVSASHGCVRLYIENAQWIYENIPDGTAVFSF